ncbi:1222_t:CDS:2 [Acaulospora colombiana]|uniref:1222_t:CDS:1 n=1 Tax=Acaulospora colombiana TaxID=27376 RepID=A0ACA9LPE1_9GLOM|nr:1222_t:CDS:2 [Acaulospora colombiana]
MSSDELEFYRQLEERVQEKIDLFKKKYPEGFHCMPRGTQILNNKRFDEWGSYIVKAPPPSQYVPLQQSRSAPPQVAPLSTTRLPPVPTQSRQQPATTSVQADQNTTAGALRSTGNKPFVDSYLSFLETRTENEDPDPSQREREEEGRRAIFNGRSTSVTISPENSRTTEKKLSENKYSAKPAGKKPSAKKPAVKTTFDTNATKNNNHAAGKITNGSSKTNNNNAAPKINGNGTSYAGQNGISSKLSNNGSSKLINNGSSLILVNNDMPKPIINSLSSNKVINNDFATAGTKTAINESITTKSYGKDLTSIVSINSIKKPKNLEEINAFLKNYFATRKEKKQFVMPIEENVTIRKRNKGKEVATKRPAQKRPVLKADRSTKRVKKSKSIDPEITDDLDDGESTLPNPEISVRKPFVVKLKIPRPPEESECTQESLRQQKFSSLRINGQNSPSRDRKDGIIRSVRNENKSNFGGNTAGKNPKSSRKSKVVESLEENTRDSEPHVSRNVKRRIDDDSSDSTSKRSKKRCVPINAQSIDAPIKSEESSTISISKKEESSIIPVRIKKEESPITITNADRNSIGMQTQLVKTIEMAIQTNSTEMVSISVQTDSEPSSTSNDNYSDSQPSSTINDESAKFHHVLYNHKTQQATNYKHRSESEKVPLNRISDYIEAYLLYADAFYNQYEAYTFGRSYSNLLNPRKFFTAVYGMDIIKDESELIGVLKYIHAVISNIFCKNDRDQCLKKESEYLNEYIDKIRNGSPGEVEEALKKYNGYLDQMKKSLKQCSDNLNEAYENLKTAKRLLGDSIIDINDSLKNVMIFARKRVDKWRQDKGITFDALGST